MTPSIFDDPTREESDEVIMSLADSIWKYDVDLAAILFLESSKPLSKVYGMMGRFIVAPFIPLVGETSMKYLATFQDKQNIEKLIVEIERRMKEKDEKAKELAKSKPPKKGWQRYLPF